MSDNGKLSHVSGDGSARMVDVSSKEPSLRMARAEATIELGPTVAAMLKDAGCVSKGPVLETARTAGILGAKRTPELIPMCHPLPLDFVSIDFEFKGDALTVISEVRCRAVTGAEMEALTAASVAALTVYDMCKSAEKGIAVSSIRLLEKSGGKSGHWKGREA